MEYYNQYTRPPYNSQFSFVGSKNSIYGVDIFYVNFHDGIHKDGFFVDQDGYLMGILKSYKWQKLGKEEFSHEIIKEIEHSKRFHSVIMIEQDKINPQLEGKYMLFKFGKAILEKIANVASNYMNTSYLKRTFYLNIESRSGFPDYSKCFFDNEQPELCNANTFGIKHHLEIDLRNEIKYPVFNIKHFERKLKLEQIQKNNEKIY